MNRSLALLLVTILLASLASDALAQEFIGSPDVRGSILKNANGVRRMLQAKAARLHVSAAGNDTVQVGYSTALTPTRLANNYWSVGAVGGAAGTINGPVQPGTPAGKPRPSQPIAGGQTGTNGIWSFENPIHGDSLQGWWPVRQYQARA